MFGTMRAVAVRINTALLTLLALLAFASNSILTRLALGTREIDAATFTFLRLLSGAVVLSLLVRMRNGKPAPLKGSGILGAAALFAYAAPFSFAYLRIGAAVGALVLFGVVQITMIGYGIFRGERLNSRAWVGLLLALAGLAILTAPSSVPTDRTGLALMTIAGVAWGIYSIAGKTARDPIAANAQSFLWSSLPAGVLLLTMASIGASQRGIFLALVSGGLTSGLGYAIWYRALPGLSVTQAAVTQLSVPVIAAIGAVAFLHEQLTLRFVLSSVAILSGVGIVLSARSRR